MARIELNGGDSLAVTAYRTEDETGEIILIVKTEDGNIRVHAGRYCDDAESLARTLREAADQADAIVSGWVDLPEENDGFVSFDHGDYYATLGGKASTRGWGRDNNIYPSKEIATYELARLMTEAGDFGSAWYESQGYTDALDEQVRAYHDEGGDQLLPLPGVRYETGDVVSLIGDDWPTWVVDGDYGDLGVMVHTAGDPDVRTFTDHDHLAPYTEEEEA